MNHNKYLQTILKILENKYDQAFEITQLFYEVDGANGNYYRAVCREKGQKEKFVAAYYLNGSDFLLADHMEGKLAMPGAKAVLVDNYPNTLLNLKVADYLVKSNTKILFAIADIGMLGHALTMDDLEQGISCCVSNKAFDIQAQIYLFVNADIENHEQFEQEMISKILSWNMYRQKINIAVVSEKSIGEIRKAYEGNTYMIEDRLEEDEKVYRYSWYFAERGQGVRKQKVVKEG